MRHRNRAAAFIALGGIIALPVMSLAQKAATNRANREQTTKVRKDKTAKPAER